MRVYRKKKGFFESLSLTNTIIFINVVVFVAVYLGFLFIGVDEIIRYVALSPLLFFPGGLSGLC